MNKFDVTKECVNIETKHFSSYGKEVGDKLNSLLSVNEKDWFDFAIGKRTRSELIISSSVDNKFLFSVLKFSIRGDKCFLEIISTYEEYKDSGFAKSILKVLFILLVDRNINSLYVDGYLDDGLNFIKPLLDRFSQEFNIDIIHGVQTF